jgi:RNA polymerase sigma-70 factor, ECF subfamily
VINQLTEKTDYDRLYREHRPRVLRLCALLLSDPEEAQEVAQEVFLRAFRHWRSTGEPESWPRWLGRVAVNACRDRYRSAWWKRWRGRTDELDRADHVVASDVPEQQIIRQEQFERIWQQFRRLSHRQQEIFALRHLEGWSTEEVGELLGITAGAVKQHLFRAVRELRGAIRDQT